MNSSSLLRIDRHRWGGQSKKSASLGAEEGSRVGKSEKNGPVAGIRAFFLRFCLPHADLCDSLAFHAPTIGLGGWFILIRFESGTAQLCQMYSSSRWKRAIENATFQLVQPKGLTRTGRAPGGTPLASVWEKRPFAVATAADHAAICTVCLSEGSESRSCRQDARGYGEAD